MKHADVNSGTHIDYGIDYNNKDPKFKDLEKKMMLTKR